MITTSILKKKVSTKRMGELILENKVLRSQIL